MQTMIPIFKAQVSRGKIAMDDPGRFSHWIKGQRDGPREIVVRRPHERKSRSEEEYLWCVVINRWADFMGYTRREAYLDLLLECSPLGFDGGGLITTSDPRWTKPLYHKWVDECRMYAAREGCVIPDPGEVDYG